MADLKDRPCEHDWQLEYLCGPTGDAWFCCRKCRAKYTKLASGITDNERRVIANCEHRWGYWDGYGPNRCEKCGTPKGNAMSDDENTTDEARNARVSVVWLERRISDLERQLLETTVYILAEQQLLREQRAARMEARLGRLEARGTDAETDTTA